MTRIQLRKEIAVDDGYDYAFSHLIIFFAALQRRIHQSASIEQRAAGVQHLLHLKSKSKILRPIEIMGFFYEIFCQIQENNSL